MEKSRSVRCKFYVTSVAQTASGPAPAEGPPPSITQEVVRLAPVYGDENKPWSKFTPCGSLELTITNPEVIGTFVPGQVHYVDISVAD